MKHIKDKLQLLRYLNLGTLVLMGNVDSPKEDGAECFVGFVIDRDNQEAVTHYFLALGEGAAELAEAEWYPAAYGRTAQEALDKLEARVAKIVLSSDVIGQWLNDVTGVERGLADMREKLDFSPRPFAELAVEF